MVLVIKQMIKTNYLLLQLQPYVISLKKSVFPSSSFLPQMDFSFDVSPFASAITNSYRAMCVTLQHPQYPTEAHQACKRRFNACRFGNGLWISISSINNGSGGNSEIHAGPARDSSGNEYGSGSKLSATFGFTSAARSIGSVESKNIRRRTEALAPRIASDNRRRSQKISQPLRRIASNSSFLKVPNQIEYGIPYLRSEDQ